MVTGELPDLARKADAAIGEQDLGLADTAGVKEQLAWRRVARRILVAEAEIEIPERDPALLADAVGPVFERVLPNEEERRRLWQAVGPGLGAGIDRLLRDVEQEASAGALRQHDPDGVLGDGLVREEIELEAVPQHRILDLPNTALRRRPGVRYNDVDTAEMHRDAIERPAHRGPIGHVAFDLERRAAELFRRSLNGLGMDVEQRHFGARLAQRARGRKADRTRTAGDDSDLSGQRLIDALAELGLFQRPVFDVE